MDIPEVLSVLRPGQDWGPCAQSDSTYAALAATWRGADPVPTEAEMLACWATLEATREDVRVEAARVAALEALAWEDGFSKATRAFLRDIYTAINDVRQHVGLSRVTEDVILPRVAGAILAGLGDAVPPAESPDKNAPGPPIVR